MGPASLLIELDIAPPASRSNKTGKGNHRLIKTDSDKPKHPGPAAIVDRSYLGTKSALKERVKAASRVWNKIGQLQFWCQEDSGAGLRLDCTEGRGSSKVLGSIPHFCTTRASKYLSPCADDVGKRRNQELLLCHNSETLSLCRQETAPITKSLISASVCMNAQGKN